jgi:hypothetical protein
MLRKLMLARDASLLARRLPLSYNEPPMAGGMVHALLAARTTALPPTPAAPRPMPSLMGGRLDLHNIPNSSVGIQGLELLRAVSLRVPDVSSITSTPTTSCALPALPTKSSGSDQRIYISEVNDSDILCGRGGKSNHHPGNKRYRQVVSEMKTMYRSTEAKTVKTDLSRAIVDHVCSYGGRFVKKDEKTGQYYLLSKAEARKKTSQALRETKALKWTL